MKAESASTYMCPHCGWLYDPAKAKGGRKKRERAYALVPAHGEPECPGTEQCPRNAKSDRRFLWNGQRPPEVAA